MPRPGCFPAAKGDMGSSAGNAAGAPAAADTVSGVAETRRLQVLGTGRRRAGLSEPMHFPDCAARGPAFCSPRARSCG